MYIMQGQTEDRFYATREKRKEGVMARKDKVPRGFIPVLIGQGEERERILVHMEQFKQPYFLELLDMAVQEFGYEQQGILISPAQQRSSDPSLVHFSSWFLCKCISLGLV